MNASCSLIMKGESRRTRWKTNYDRSSQTLPSSRRRMKRQCRHRRYGRHLRVKRLRWRTLARTSATSSANSGEARAQKEWSHTILQSIGDAVIATDDEGAISFMTPVAEHLTGWTLQEAEGAALTKVFRIVNEQTRQIVENPVDKVRRLDR